MLEKTIELHHPLSSLPLGKGGEVRYTLRRSRRARGVRLSVACGGVFTVTAPPWVRISRIEAFILKKSAWALDKIQYFSKFPRRTLTRNRKWHFAEHKEQARALVHERLAHFNQHYGFRWNRTAVRNQKSRWGSCSRKRNLNFNYKLALLPPRLADYIIVHELCHLGELNHAPKFWGLVARAIPEHRALRRELRRVGVGLL